MLVPDVTYRPGEDVRNGSPDEVLSQAWTFRTLPRIEFSDSRVFDRLRRIGRIGWRTSVPQMLDFAIRKSYLTLEHKRGKEQMSEINYDIWKTYLCGCGLSNKGETSHTRGGTKTMMNLDLAEVVREVSVHHLPVAPVHQPMRVLDGNARTPARPIGVLFRGQMGFEDRRQH